MLVSPGRIGAIGAAARRRGGGSALDRILGAGGLDYAFYDFTQTDRTFQESVGPTPADDVGEAVGLWLDRHEQGNKTLAQVMAGQTDILNGAGAGDSLDGWTAPVAGSTASIVNGRFRVASATGTAGRLVHPVACAPGKVYALTAERYTGLSVPSLVVSNEPVNFGGVNILQVTGAADNTVFFVAAQATQYIMLVSNSATEGNYAEFDNILVRELPAHYALQATGNARGIRQADGIKYDGSDDNHLTDWLAQAGANCIIAKVVVPADVPVSQVIVGSVAAGPSDRMYLYMATTGKVNCGVGNDLSVAAGALPDVRGTTATVGMSIDGSTVKLFCGESEVTEAQDGLPNTSVPFRVGGLNAGGLAGNFFSGGIAKIAFGKVPLTLSQFQQITAEWAD